MKASAKGLTLVLLAAVVLALSISFKKSNAFMLASLISFFIIIGVNILGKKIAGYFFETKVKSKLWHWYQFGFRKDAHFKTPIPMVWLPLVLSLFSRGTLWWLAILEFDVEARPERASRRHGLYRFTEVTEWHIGLIALWGIIANIIFGVVAYLIGGMVGYPAQFELFAKLSFYYAIWSILPLSSLDGSKILYASRFLWTTVAIILLVLLAWGMAIVV